MLSRPLSPAYTQRCLTALRGFAQADDTIIALCPSYDPTASCGFCQKPAIYRCFPIQNMRTGAIMTLGIECIQAYRALARKLRRGKENYRDPGTIATIVKRYWSRGELTDEQMLDFMTAGRVMVGAGKQSGRLKVERRSEER